MLIVFLCHEAGAIQQHFRKGLLFSKKMRYTPTPNGRKKSTQPLLLKKLRISRLKFPAYFSLSLKEQTIYKIIWFHVILYLLLSNCITLKSIFHVRQKTMECNHTPSQTTYFCFIFSIHLSWSMEWCKLL